MPAGMLPVYILIMDGISLQTIRAPRPLPVPKPVARLKKYQGSRTRDAAGPRLVRRLGSHVSLTMFKFRVGFFTPAETAQLQNRHDLQEPFPFVVQNTTYTVLFDEGGWNPQLAPLVGYDEFYFADCDLLVLSQNGG